MSAPLKRVCRQAARQAIQCSSQSISRQPLTSSLQCRTALPTAVQQQRQYTHTPRCLAGPQRRRRQKPETLFNEQDEDEAESVFDSTEDLIDDLPSEGDISSTGHAELDQHRELREMVRLAAWEMPLLASLAEPHQPADRYKQPLRWRYTTYFGEPHPGSRKVVVEFKVDKYLGIEEKHLEKLRKLCGTRYNPEKNSVRMSSDSFETQAQNKRYLGDTIKNLIAEATDPNADSFEDVPLDTRHFKSRRRPGFPEAWKVTEERAAQLEEKRKTLLLEEGQRVENNTVVSGIAAIEAARKINLMREEQPVMAEAKQALPKVKMGRKEMGQTRGAQRK